MNPTFREWQRWRVGEPAGEGDCVLDELNPFGVFADLLPEETSGGKVSPDRVLENWCEWQGFSVGPERVIGCGIRDLLRAACSVFRERIDSVWLPEDVYPAYRGIIGGAGRVREFTVNPDPDLSFLERSGDRDLLLFPAPLHPAGRFPLADEVARLCEWVRERDQRWLLVDTVYDYRDRQAGELDPLRSEERCVVLRSMSKAWLCRQQFGVAEFPAEIAEQVRSLATVPEKADLARCQTALETGVLDRQRRQMADAWDRVERELNPHLPGWKRPENGYLAMIPGDWVRWRHKGVRAVPFSVFGARRRNLSVVSCLAFVGSGGKR